MTFETFVSRVDNLVWKWAGAQHGDSITPRDELRKIYDDVGEQAVHKLAETVEARQRARLEIPPRLPDTQNAYQ
jgi:hypothetical protein